MNILSIDGGGIKGLYSAAFLAGLENKFGKETYDCFDLVAGTSTGGILALAIAARIPVKDIVEFYKQWGPRIFRTRFNILRNLLFSKYSNKELIKALQSIFGNTRIKDIYSQDKRISVCIPSIDVIQGTPTVFKTPHNSRLSRDNEQYLWEIALATSSAPTFFPLAKIRIPQSSAWKLFVDGGLWANNPSLVAITEALTYHKQTLENIYMLSLGNIESTTSLSSNTYLNKGFVLWQADIVGITMDTQSIAVHNQIQLLFSSKGLSDHYIRIQHKPNKRQNSLKKLDVATFSNLNDLEALGRSRAESESRNNIVKKFFSKEV